MLDRYASHNPTRAFLCSLRSIQGTVIRPGGSLLSLSWLTALAQLRPFQFLAPVILSVVTRKDPSIDSFARVTHSGTKFFPFRRERNRAKGKVSDTIIARCHISISIIIQTSSNAKFDRIVASIHGAKYKKRREKEFARIWNLFQPQFVHIWNSPLEIYFLPFRLHSDITIHNIVDHPQTLDGH